MTKLAFVIIKTIDRSACAAMQSVFIQKGIKEFSIGDSRSISIPQQLMSHLLSLSERETGLTMKKMF